jgi:hypothetical protein
VDWIAIYLVVGGVVLLALVAAMFWATYRRMTGRTSRFDSGFETMVKTQGAGIYPPSLRPDPDAPAIEVVEDSRASRTEHETPSLTKT